MHSPISILAVDDEEAHLSILQNTLSMEAYDVTTASDGVQAINILHINIGSSINKHLNNLRIGR